MAKGLNDYSSQESVSPYISAVVATTNDQPDTRAVHMKGTSADVTLTVNDVDVVFHLLKGHTYPISCTKASANTVVMLY
tara:strand:+ start:367 stop:603 length:237 start_codon:yes stop_codon:yes gene_type:complete